MKMYRFLVALALTMLFQQDCPPPSLHRRMRTKSTKLVTSFSRSLEVGIVAKGD